METEPPGTGKPKPAKREVKIPPPVQLTGIRRGERKRGAKGWAVFVPIHLIAISTTARSSSSLQLNTQSLFPPHPTPTQYVFRKLGSSLKKWALSSMKLCPCPAEQASAILLSQEEWMCPQQAEYRKKKNPDSSPASL